MDMMPVKPERKADLEVYAQRHGKSTADALDDLLAAQLEWEKQDYKEALAGIKRGYEDIKPGGCKTRMSSLKNCA